MSENITICMGSELLWILNVVFQHECIMCCENQPADENKCQSHIEVTFARGLTIDMDSKGNKPIPTH
jgi:hypothetical protein